MGVPPPSLNRHLLHVFQVYLLNRSILHLNLQLPRSGECLIQTLRGPVRCHNRPYAKCHGGFHARDSHAIPRDINTKRVNRQMGFVKQITFGKGCFRQLTRLATTSPASLSYFVSERKASQAASIFFSSAVTQMGLFPVMVRRIT